MATVSRDTDPCRGRLSGGATRGWLLPLILALPLSSPAGAAPRVHPGAAAPASASKAASAPLIPAGPTLARIRETGVVVMGYRPASLPFSYLDAQLKPIGYTVELCDRVIQALRTRLKMPDLEVRRVAVGSATRLPMVTNGTLDLECGITTNTAERARTQAFSLTIFVAETRLMTRNGERVQSLAELRGRPVVSTIGTTSIQHLAAINDQQQLGIRIVAGLDDPDAFQLLRSGRAEAFLMDDVLLRSLLAQQGGAVSSRDYVVSDRGLTVEPYAIGLSRGDPAFKALVDETIAHLYRSGEIFAIYKRWFESPLPNSGVNLQLPMNAALRRAIAQPTDAPDPERYR
jgi:glutamate/aspartate transport system substrate-binding protein